MWIALSPGVKGRLAFGVVTHGAAVSCHPRPTTLVPAVMKVIWPRRGHCHRTNEGEIITP